MNKNEWILCPIFGDKTRDRIREDTIQKNYPLYCPKCKQETLIKVKSLQVTVIKEPNAQTTGQTSIPIDGLTIGQAISANTLRGWQRRNGM